MANLERTNPIYALMRRLHAERKLTPAQAKFMAPRRPHEELYDLERDPFELTDIAGQPQHQATLARVRAALEAWLEQTHDTGRIPEDPDVRSKILDEHARKMEGAKPQTKR
ncbi:MAG TPA: hypothetical protein PLU30_07810 [Verrucomicrobiae bacterium]|nr:hypothetical protein [Verrucomicrobiae bacterium]